MPKRPYDCPFFHDGVHCTATFTKLLDRLLHVTDHITAGDASRRTVSCWRCAHEDYPDNHGVVTCGACGFINDRYTTKGQTT